MRLARWSASAIVAIGLLGLASSAEAENKNVLFLSWGGTIQTMLEKEGWADKFKKETGYTVTLVPKATSTEIMATAISQKDKPQVDVVMCDLIAFYEGIRRGIFAPLDPKSEPNLAKMAEQAKIENAGVANYADILAIAYREDVFKKHHWAPPTSWKDLERPEFKGQLIIPPASNTYGLYALIELARLHGGSEKNIDPGFAALKKIAPGVVDWTTTFAKIGDLMENEQGSIAVFNTVSFFEIKKRGVPIDVVVPKPVYMSPTVVGAMKNSPNPEGAHVLLNWLIGEEFLAYRASRFSQTPMNREVKVSEEEAKKGVLTPDQLNGLVQIDYNDVVQHRAEWDQRFEREVATIK
jgi:putative spermidine/putrescine transport system substrate-binding protein